jgi:amino acid efflux transporter
VDERGSLGVLRGSALYVGALIGPGLLLVPALAAQSAGAASIVAWGALLVLSAPLAITFAALGVRHPVAGGVATYVREGFGDAAAAVAGAWFLSAVLIGGPAVSLIGGYYVADLTGSGTLVATLVGLAMFGAVMLANVLGLRVSSGFQLVLASILVVVVAVAISFALPSRGGHNWTPFAPHGWWAVGTAANLLIWLFLGWEAVAQLVGEFRRPEVDLPRAMALAFGVVTLLYAGLAVATIGVTGGTRSRVPLADIVSVGFGRSGRDATAVLAVALTMGTMNVYYGGASKLAAALAEEGALPRWLAGDAYRSVPRRPLAVIAPISVVLIAALVAGLSSTEQLVRGTSACFIAVYVLAIGSAFRILRGRVRSAAFITLVLTIVLGVFSAQYLAVPVVVAGGALLLRRRLRVADDDPLAVDAHDRGPRDLVMGARPDPEPVEHARSADAQRDDLQA